MKTITIGRDSSCTICINDERISRRHALLKIHNTGKMEIVDMSSNGTYVNGIKLAKNVPFPVTRKNSVVFGHARQLDWSDVPDPTKPIKIIALSVLGLIVVAVIVIFSVKSCNKTPEYYGGSSSVGNEKTEVGVPSNSNEGISSTDPSPTQPSSTERDVILPEQEKDPNAQQPTDTTKKGNSWYNKEIQKAAAASSKKDSAAQPKKKNEPSKTTDDKKKGNKTSPTQIF